MSKITITMSGDHRSGKTFIAHLLTRNGFRILQEDYESKRGKLPTEKLVVERDPGAAPERESVALDDIKSGFILFETRRRMAIQNAHGPVSGEALTIEEVAQKNANALIDCLRSVGARTVSAR